MNYRPQPERDGTRSDRATLEQWLIRLDRQLRTLRNLVLAVALVIGYLIGHLHGDIEDIGRAMGLGW